MPNENNVIFKGRKGGLMIALDKNAEFEDICAVLKFKLSKQRSFFDDPNATVVFKGRVLSGEEETEIKKIIDESIGINVNYSPPPAASKSSKNVVEPQKEIENSGANAPIPETPKEEIVEKTESSRHSHIEYDHNAKFVMGALRSGNSVHFGGSVIINGDVNPGAEVIAEGNIIVLGSLLGLAHAGCKGDSNAFIMALMMRPTQLRIADIITRMPETIEKKPIKKNILSGPLYAYAKDGQIYITEMS